MKRRDIVLTGIIMGLVGLAWTTMICWVGTVCTSHFADGPTRTDCGRIDTPELFFIAFGWIVLAAIAIGVVWQHLIDEEKRKGE